MTTSPLPWTIQLETDFFEAGHRYIAYIKDASGNEIGYFKDARDAELVLEAVNPQKYKVRISDNDPYGVIP